MNAEEIRLKIKEEFYRKPKMDSDDMWYVIIAYRDIFGELTFTRAYFEQRYDAEKFISNYWDRPCYVKMSGDDIKWNRVDELLGEE